MTSILIEKNIPIPQIIEMEIGDSFAIKFEDILKGRTIQSILENIIRSYKALVGR
mgnify:FL=1